MERIEQVKTALIVYESKYGNTKRLAGAIAEGIRQAGNIECKVVSVGEVQPDELPKYEMILFGCPNHMQGPSRGLMSFIDRAAIVNLSGKTGAAFDTYMGGNKGIAVTKLELKIRQKLPGVRLVIPGLSAEVRSRTRPLVEEEIPRAGQFGKTIGEALLKQP